MQGSSKVKAPSIVNMEIPHWNFHHAGLLKGESPFHSEHGNSTLELIMQDSSMVKAPM
jgi:hypothetical protein